MPLPILHGPIAPSPADLIRLFHRTSLHLAEQLAEPAALEVGTAFASAELPDVHEANHVQEAALPEGMSPAQAVAEVDSFFASRRRRCAYWVINPSAPAARTEPLVEHLRTIGFSPCATDIMHLRGATRTAAEPGSLTIIPARASFKHARQIAEEAAARHPDRARQLVEARMKRLDDPHWEALLALKDGRAVATAGVLAAGDVGRIHDVFVSESFRRQGIGQALIARALEICARSLFKHVLLGVPPENVAAICLFERHGFGKIGQVMQYMRSGQPDPRTHP